MPELAWHFLNADMRANSGQEGPWSVGETRRIDGDIELCRRGYHASENIRDAMSYANGPIICRVLLNGTIRRDNDKMVASERTLLWALPLKVSERVLHEFACHVAEDALIAIRDSGGKVDDRSWRAIEAKRLWIDGCISDQDLSAAWSAAESAAWSAYAAWSAARSAAWSAAKSAAESAAKSAAKSAANDLLEDLAVIAAIECGINVSVIGTVHDA